MRRRAIETLIEWEWTLVTGVRNANEFWKFQIKRKFPTRNEKKTIHLAFSTDMHPCISERMCAGNVIKVVLWDRWISLSAKTKHNDILEHWFVDFSSNKQTIKWLRFLFYHYHTLRRDDCWVEPHLQKDEYKQSEGSRTTKRKNAANRLLDEAYSLVSGQTEIPKRKHYLWDNRGNRKTKNLFGSEQSTQKQYTNNQ